MPTILMHVLGTARTDVRVMRAATALVDAGYHVTVIDLNDPLSIHRIDIIQGVTLQHLAHPRMSLQSGTLFKAPFLFMRALWWLLTMRCDAIHAHDKETLPACFVAAHLRHKPLVFETHELPFHEYKVSELSMSKRVLRKILQVLLKYMIPRCSEIIVVSKEIGEIMKQEYRLGV